MHVIPLNLPRANGGDVALTQAELGQVVNLYASLIAGSAAGTGDGGRADNGRLDRRGGRLYNDLVDIAVRCVVWKVKDPVQVRYVVVLLLGERGLTEALGICVVLGVR